MRSFVQLVAVVMTTIGPWAPAHAQDIAAGQAIYQSVCNSCHGPAANNFNGIVTTGANNPAAILAAWTRPGSQMNGLEQVYNAQARANIAAYLGTFLPASGEVRVSTAQLDFGAQAVNTRSATQTVSVSNFTGSVTITGIANNDAPEFPIVTDSCSGVTLGPGQSCRLDIAFQPAALGPRGTTVMIANSGVVNPLSFTALGTGTAAPPPSSNYQGLWWGGAAEDGWGINLAQQGDLIYMTWYTYDATGKASWLAMLANRTAPGTYAGSILEVRGSPYDAVPYNPNAKVAQTVGTGTLSFIDTANGTFAFAAKSVSRTIAIQRFVFGPQPSCTASASPNFTAASNYQDLWWNPSEDGWGINFAHQGNAIYATWYTYDHDGSPLWLASLMSPAGAGTWSGALLRVSGAPFGPTYDPTRKTATTVGTATLALANGNAATWSYSINSAPGQKSITRFAFGSPLTLCQ
jgi:mono/diheme cytochrome c family protein